MPNDGMRLRSNNRASNRDTQSYVTAFGGEWETDDAKVVFEVSAAKSDTETSSLRFQYLILQR